MGIPYSKEINKAFDELNVAYGQVTPLVAAAYEVLETTKNIALIILGIEILSVVLLGLVLLALVGLLITVNPDLQRERRELVTPVLKWVVGWLGMGQMAWVGLVLGLVLVGTMGLFGWSRWVNDKIERVVEGGETAEEEEGGDEAGKGESGEEEEGTEKDKEAEKEREKAGKK